MQKQECLDQIARHYNYQDWNDLFWNGDISQAIIDDVMELYADQALEIAYKQGFNDGRVLA